MAESMAADTRERVQSLGDQVQEQARIVLDNGKDDAAPGTVNGNGNS